jgi:hypothetical protein
MTDELKPPTGRKLILTQMNWDHYALPVTPELRDDQKPENGSSKFWMAGDRRAVVYEREVCGWFWIHMCRTNQVSCN